MNFLITQESSLRIREKNMKRDGYKKPTFFNYFCQTNDKMFMHDARQNRKTIARESGPISCKFVWWALLNWGLTHGWVQFLVDFAKLAAVSSLLPKKFCL